MKAVFADTIIAESANTVVVEGNHYFPQEDVHMDYLKPSEHKSICPWKGEAGYYHVTVGDQQAENATWVYAEPKEKAVHIKGHIAFWKGVKVVED